VINHLPEVYLDQACTHKSELFLLDLYVGDPFHVEGGGIKSSGLLGFLVIWAKL